MMYRSLSQYTQALILEQEIHKKESKSRRVRRFVFIILAIICIVFGSYLVVSEWDTLKKPKYIGYTYYISRNGDDKNDGLTAQTAWKTIDKVNVGKYRGGDQILFEGGSTFTGNMGLYAGRLLDTDLDHPITISSYGTGKATINAPSGRAISLANVGNIFIDSIRVVGGTSGCTNDHDGIHISNSGSKRVSHIRILHVEASGFCVGIAVVAKTPGSTSGIHIQDVSVHNNAEFGMAIRGNVGDLTVVRTVAFGNTGGISVFGVEGAAINYNAVFDNGGTTVCKNQEEEGPGGIEVAGTKIVIEKNEVFRQKKNAKCEKGNGAFRLTGTHITVQKNYTHDNDGPAIFIKTEIPRKDTIIRYNISENDSRRTSQGVVDIIGQASDIEFYNNTMYSERTDGDRGPLVSMRSASTVGDRSKPYNHVHFRNNIFLTNKDATVIRFDDPANGTDIQFQNNVYFDNGGVARVVWDGDSYQSVAQWAKNTKQEEINNTLTLKITNPLLCNVGGGGTMHPKSLDRLKAYMLQSISPLIDQGVDVWGMEISSADFRNFSNASDFWGNTVPSGSTYDIGASEFINGQTCE